ncbi:MAG: hypothetical protein KDJ19_11865 [Hyphomicrobiaceae bacterium]|nr:hypothetical protein [Hyphomicrobiaceae bacterium]MCC0024865.1 hypothetical protein [Hyphomicrobiaceae bacterium]
MLYLPEILNRHNLFLALNGLNKPTPTFSDLKEAIINHGSDAFQRMERIRGLNERILVEFSLFADQMHLISEERVVFASQSMGSILTEISPFFATLRVLQNKILALISAWESVRLPSSMSDLCKKPEKYNLSVEARQLIQKYWETSGKHIKFYRDIDQHNFSRTDLTSRYFVRFVPELVTYIELPDYQATRNESAFTYDNKINALEFLDEAAYQIHELIENLAKSYGATPTPHRDSVRLDQLGELVPRRYRTIAVMYESRVQHVGDKNVLNIKALRIDQNEDGKMTLQQMTLDDDQLKKASSLYGIAGDRRPDAE